MTVNSPSVYHDQVTWCPILMLAISGWWSSAHPGSSSSAGIAPAPPDNPTSSPTGLPTTGGTTAPTAVLPAQLREHDLHPNLPTNQPAVLPVQLPDCATRHTLRHSSVPAAHVGAEQHAPGDPDCGSGSSHDVTAPGHDVTAPLSFSEPRVVHQPRCYHGATFSFRLRRAR